MVYVCANKIVPDNFKAEPASYWVIFAIEINRLCNLEDRVNNWGVTIPEPPYPTYFSLFVIN